MRILIIFAETINIMKVNIIGGLNSVFNQFISEIRCEVIQKDPMRFRKNLQRLGEIFAYEISKVMDYEITEIKTPLGIAKVSTLVQHPVLATILRAGLPLQQGLLNIFDHAENAFISAYRKYDAAGEFHIEFEYLASPSLDGKVVILSDPMLASGSSMEIGYRALMEKGTPKQVHLVVVIASTQGVEYVTKHITAENVTLWIGAVDPDMTHLSYIVPGLGDAGDLAFGAKIDSH